MGGCVGTRPKQFKVYVLKTSMFTKNTKLPRNLKPQLLSNLKPKLFMFIQINPRPEFKKVPLMMKILIFLLLPKFLLKSWSKILKCRQFSVVLLEFCHQSFQILQ